MQYCVFIAVTTGIGAREVLNSKKPPIIDLAAISIDLHTNQILSTFEHKLTFNEYLADGNILSKYTNYNRNLWQLEAQNPVIIAKSFLKWLVPYHIMSKCEASNVIIGGYNCNNFTKPLLINWYKAINNYLDVTVGLTPLYTNKTIDVLEMVRVWDVVNTFEGLTSKSLASVGELYGIDLPVKSAMDRVKLTFEVYKRLVGLLREGIRVF